MRITPSRKTAEKYVRRLEEHNPGTGVVRVIRLTEKQYENIWYLTGGPDMQEELVGRNGHITI
jgi:CRISPR-associated protein Cas2